MKTLLKENLFSNLKIIKNGIKNKKVCAVVKANAYGHGSVNIVKALKNSPVDYFAVSSLAEAVEILPFTKKKILILSPLSVKELEQLKELKIKNLELTAASYTDLKRILKLNIKIPLHLKLNCGFNRFGIKNLSQLKKITDILNKNIKIKIAGIFTHISGKDTMKKECNKFLKFLKYLNTLRSGTLLHIGGAHSVNAINYLNNKLQKINGKFDLMLRSGINLYGYEGVYFTNKLKPVMKITAEVMAVQQLKTGEICGYNESFTAKQRSKIAVLKIGYADGFLREMKGISIFLKYKIANAKNSLPPVNNYYKVAAVCMDYVLIDITGSKNIKIGTHFEILGENISAVIYAKKLNTITYEILTNFSKTRY